MPSSRRTFLKTTAAAALSFPAILRAANLNSKLQIAAVGASGKGFSDISEIGSHPAVQYVGFADVDTARFAKAAQSFRRCRSTRIFARCSPSSASIRRGHLLHARSHARRRRHGGDAPRQTSLQPKTAHPHAVEARQMRLLAEKTGVIKQMGNQIHSSTQYRTAVKLIQSGAVGKIKESIR